MNTQQNSSPGIMYIRCAGDDQMISDMIENYKKLNDQQVKETILRKRELGFIGARGYGVSLLAFHQFVTERYGDSPIAFEHNCFLRWKEDEPQRFIRENLKTEENES